MLQQDHLLPNLSLQTQRRIRHRNRLEEKAWQGYADGKCSNWLAPPRLRSWQYGNVLESRALSYYCLPQTLLRHIWDLRRDAKSRAANDWRKMTKDLAAAVQKALLL